MRLRVSEVVETLAGRRIDICTVQQKAGEVAGHK